jgi:serine/threonine protein kinase
MTTGVSLSINPAELELGQVIGQGSCGIVNAGRHIPSGTLLAIKVSCTQSINIYERDRRRQLENDLKVLDGYNSPYLVRYYGAFFNEGTVKVVMELMDFGSVRRLLDLIGGRPMLPEHVLFAITVPVAPMQILKGLHYLHRVKHTMHRDIKPDNVLLSSRGEVKLSDFGIASELANSSASALSFVGTLSYMSPERMEHATYNYSADLWSLGLVVYELASGRHPYPVTHNIIEMIENIRNLPAPTLGSEHSPELVDFVGQW